MVNIKDIKEPNKKEILFNLQLNNVLETNLITDIYAIKMHFSPTCMP